VGYYEDGKLKFAGHVGSGFDEESVKRVQAAPGSLQGRALPFRRKASAQQSDHLGETRARGRAQISGLARDRHFARAPYSCGCAMTSIRSRFADPARRPP
jgi:hypothetical protein